MFAALTGDRSVQGVVVKPGNAKLDAKTGRLAFSPVPADIGAGRLAVDEPLANRVRSGRKQP
jgi:hypothetical protein